MTELYLFGAGASAAEGAPATAQLLSEAWAQNPAQHSQVWRFLTEVWAQPIDSPDSFAHLPRLDEALSLIDWSLEMEQGLGPDWGPRRLWDLRQELTALIEETLGAAMAQGLPQPGGPHERFVAGLQGRPAVLLSLNYDTILDRALRGGGYEPDYGFARLDLAEPAAQSAPRPFGAPAIPLLKLHGSLNWARCPACDRIELLTHPGLQATCDQPAAPRACPRCGGHSLDRILISPTWLKRYTATQLRHVWDLAFEALTRAERITLIGYSLPPQDVAVAQLLRRALLARPQGRPLAIRVLNHGEPRAPTKAELAGRFIRHFGPQVTFNWEGFGGVPQADAFRPFQHPV